MISVIYVILVVIALATFLAWPYSKKNRPEPKELARTGEFIEAPQKLAPQSVRSVIISAPTNDDEEAPLDFGLRPEIGSMVVYDTGSTSAIYQVALVSEPTLGIERIVDSDIVARDNERPADISYL